MMKLKVIFLLTSLCSMLNASAPEPQQSQTSHGCLESKQKSLDKKEITTKAIPTPTALSAAANTTTAETSTTPTDKIESAPAAPQGSTLLTKAIYGAAALLGKSRGTILLEMYQNGTLEADLLKNPKSAEDRLRDAAEERCKARELKNPENQLKLFNIFKAQKDLATKTKKSYSLDQQRADEYNPLLSDALQAIITHHATEVQPALNKKRIDEKAAADAAYEKEMKDVHLAFAAHAASNKRNMDEQASKKTNCDIQKEEHYQSVATYEKLLDTIRNQTPKK